MRKEKKYGVYGLIEWDACIPFGNTSTMRINFSGGSVSGFGQTPATYTTRNRLTQAVIENSQFFKEGRIHLLSETVIESDEEEVQPTPPTTEPPTTEEAPAAPTTAEKTIKVADLTEAKQYLMEEHHMAASALRGEKSIKKAAHDVGVVFEGI